MLQISGLKKSFGAQLLFDEVSFSINPGERIGLVGRNGHGKTTLLRLILGEEAPDEGVIQIPSDYRIGHLSQQICFQKPTVLEEGETGLPPADGMTDRSYQIKRILLGLGFVAEEFSIDPRLLSGGFQVRLNLAKLLVSSPNLLLLDEPTNYLDIVSMRWVARFLQSWKGELIMITHDRSFMDSVCTCIVGIHRTTVRKIAGTTAKYYEQIQQEEEIHEQTRANQLRQRAQVERFVERFRYKASKAKSVQSRIKTLAKTPPLDELADIPDLHFAFKAADFDGKRLFQTTELSFRYNPGSPQLIEGLNLHVGSRDRVAVIGRNGKGKTTLLNLLAGEISPSTGLISRSPRLQPAFFGQTNIDRLDQELTVEAEILCVQPEHSLTAARTICGLMMFSGDAALKKIKVLSGGERSRVLLGKILAAPANLLLLDEPTNHLDQQSTESLLRALDDFPGAIVLVTHNEMLLHRLPNKLVVFDGGRIFVFEGGYQEFLDKIGWCGEEPAPDSAMAPENRPSKRELRRQRAQIAEQQAKVLVPLQKEIAALESAIIALEEKNAADTRQLNQAAMQGRGQEAARLAKELNDSQAEIERLFARLEETSRQFSKLSRSGEG